MHSGHGSKLQCGNILPLLPGYEPLSYESVNPDEGYRTPIPARSASNGEAQLTLPIATLGGRATNGGGTGRRMGQRHPCLLDLLDLLYATAAPPPTPMT